MEAEKKIIQSNMMIEKEIEKMRKDAEEGDRQMDMGKMGKRMEKREKGGRKRWERDKLGREMSNMGEDVIGFRGLSF